MNNNCMYYKCRSLLACDGGGTVFDTSTKFKQVVKNIGNDGESYPNISSQPDRIIYVINQDNHCEKYEKLSVDSTTHLDDDEFNDYEMTSNISCDEDGSTYTPVKETIKFIDIEKKNEQSKCYNIFAEDEYKGNNSVKSVLNTVMSTDQNSSYLKVEHLQNYSGIRDNIYIQDINHNNIQKNNFVESSKNHLVVNTSELQYLPNNKSKNNNMNSQEIFNYDVILKSNSEKTNKSHLRKRKQVYSVKEDSFVELYEGSPYEPSDDHKRKKKLNEIYSFQYQKNPFANVKMSSILKGNRNSFKNINNEVKKNEPVISILESPIFSRNVDPTNKPVMCQKNDNFSLLKKSPASVKSNSIKELNIGFNDVNYFEYIEPREKIVESNMDKLLSPTVESDDTVINHFVMNKQQAMKSRDINSITNSIIPQSKEAAEEEFLKKSLQAQKQGFDTINIFNTSNDDLIDEIIFDLSFAYKNIQLDIDYDKITIPQLNMSNTFTTNTCTLLDSLNEFNRFGGFISDYIESNSMQTNHSNKPSVTSYQQFQNKSLEELSMNIKKELVDGRNDRNSNNSTFNFSDKSNLLGVDFQTRCQTSENHSQDMNPMLFSDPLKIKIKRVNEIDNQYLINGINRKSSIQKKNPKSAPKLLKILDKYECNDCLQTFRTKRLLKTHISDFHKGPYDVECEICHMKFKKSSAHKNHKPWCKKAVEYKCKLCPKIYRYQASLNKHLKTHVKIN
ncbi:hypothetical protein TKK_0011463 [Trichogramma kaykai]|uniref:C2H2-type domain-containing protein n=1 Tax=Trichogramma kaykai TaxID=54128 RepID=A0ABD2WR08_9HYME